MDEIAAQLAISKKTIYQFFTDKDAMVEAVVDDEMKKNEEDCRIFHSQAENAVHENFLASDSIQEMLKTMNPQIMYDLEKHHPSAYKRLKQFKYQYLYEIIIDNLDRGLKEEIYRIGLHTDLIARHRIESSFMPFNQEVFPPNKYPMNQTCQELAVLFLHSICNAKGKGLIEKYLNERQKTMLHEQKIS